MGKYTHVHNYTDVYLCLYIYARHSIHGGLDVFFNKRSDSQRKHQGELWKRFVKSEISYGRKKITRHTRTIYNPRTNDNYKSKMRM